MTDNTSAFARLAEAMTGGEPSERFRRQQGQSMMASLLRQGTSAAPISSPWEGVSRMAAGALSGYMYGNGMFGLGAGNRISPVGGGFDASAARAMPGGFMPGFGGS